MNCCSEASISDPMVSEGYSGFDTLHLPTLLAHRLSPSDDDSSALCDSGVSSQAPDGNDDDFEPPPVLDLYDKAASDPVNCIEDEAPSSPDDSDVPLSSFLTLRKVAKTVVVQKPSSITNGTVLTDATEKVRRSVRQARRKIKEKQEDEGLGRKKTDADRRADVVDWSGPVRCKSEDRDVCVWIDKPSALKNVELEELVDLARKQLGMYQEEVLQAVYNNGYDLLAALEHIEEYLGPRELPFSKNDQRAFFQGMRACNNKDFVYIKTNYLPSRKVTELVDYYYKTKNTKCFGEISDRCCPLRMKLDSEEEPVTSRNDCANCTGMIQDENFKMESLNLCALCGLYYRKTNKLRPFTVPLVSPPLGKRVQAIMKAKEDVSDTVSTATTSSTCSEKGEHRCSFVRKKLAKLRTTRWTPTEKQEAVMAFLKFGKDFGQIARAVGTKSASDVKRFYVNHASEYRLDFLMNHSPSIVKAESGSEACNTDEPAAPEQAKAPRHPRKRRLRNAQAGQ